MKLDKYFDGNKFNIKSYVKYYKMLNDNVSKLQNKNSALLNGEKTNYKKLIQNKFLHYETKNPRIVLEELSNYFRRSVVWENAGTMINITPPTNKISLVAADYCNKFNPNFAQDESSGYLMTTELLTVKYLSDMVGWDWLKSRGTFTFGGKGTIMYAIKDAINKCCKDVRNSGVDKNIKIISNDKGHPCHIEVCDWLGLGRDACLRLPTSESGQVDLKELEFTLRENLSNGVKIAAIILNGGTTNEVIVDPIKEVVDMRDKLVVEYGLDYIPHVHIDSVIGWAWLFFKNYDFESNSLNMTKDDKKKIKSLSEKISQIKYADSFGADFHKTGFCPYISSCIVFKNGKDLYNLGGRELVEFDNLNFGTYSPFEYTLELSRSAIGPVSAYVALETFGVKGFQQLIYEVFKRGQFIRRFLSKQDKVEVINKETEGFATLFVIHPQNKNYKYLDYLSLDDKEVKDFLEYNHKFYLYTLQLLENKQVDFKITFSKSYKPYGAKKSMGALKIYQTSPLSKFVDIKKCLLELINAKTQFENGINLTLKEDSNTPKDFVYR